MNNPTIEYFPPKKLDFAPRSPQLPIPSPFLIRTLASNLYPIVITLPTPDTVFMAANNDAMLYNWRTGVERPLPAFPNGVRVTYPFSGTGLLLPLSHQNGYEAEVLICGGSALSDTLTSQQVKVSDPASAQCVRMVLNERGIARGWKVEEMPEPRVMPDAVMMPDGKVLIVNGASTVRDSTISPPPPPTIIILNLLLSIGFLTGYCRIRKSQRPSRSIQC